MCGSSELPWQLGAQWSRTNTLPTQWCLHAAAFYDRLDRRLCSCQVALSCSHCEVVNQTLQIRRIGHRSADALSSAMLQITAMCQCPMSDSIIGLTLQRELSLPYKDMDSSFWSLCWVRFVLSWINCFRSWILKASLQLSSVIRQLHIATTMTELFL